MAEAMIWNVEVDIDIAGMEFTDEDLAQIRTEAGRRKGALVERSADGLKLRSSVQAITEHDAWGLGLSVFDPYLVFALPGLDKWRPVSIKRVEGPRGPCVAIHVATRVRNRVKGWKR